jgi:hypothetical protein
VTPLSPPTLTRHISFGRRRWYSGTPGERVVTLDDRRPGNVELVT